jgi:hypothetical protein
MEGVAHIAMDCQDTIVVHEVFVTIVGSFVFGEGGSKASATAGTSE